MAKFFVKLYHSVTGALVRHEVVEAATPEAADTISRAAVGGVHGHSSEISVAPNNAPVGLIAADSELPQSPVPEGSTASEALGEGGSSPYGYPGMPEGPDENSGNINTPTEEQAEHSPS